MPTADEARRELARRELERRRAAQALAPAVVEADPSSAVNPFSAEELNKRAAALGRTGIQGLTMGGGDELQAAMGTLPVMALKRLMTDESPSMGETYEHLLGLSRGELAQAREDYPLQSFVSEIAGSLPTGGLAAKGVAAASPKVGSALAQFAARNPVKAAAATAAGAGSVYGFAEGEGGAGERGMNALKYGAFAVPFGAGGGLIAGKLGSRGASLADDVADDLDELVPTGFTKTNGQKSKTSALARLSPEQQARSQVLTEAGIPREKQTAAMISRDPKLWQFEQNTKGISGVGDDIRNRYIQANEFIKGRLGELGIGIKGKATTPFEAGENVVEAVTKKSREMQDEIGKMYGKIREKVGEEAGLSPNRILEALDEAGDNAYADNIVNSMKRKMKRYGIKDAGKGTLSVKNAEELRKFANSLRGDRQTDHIVGDIINALDDDVIDTAGTDAFKAARDSARARFSQFETKLLKNISEEKIVADDVLKRTVYGGKVNDLRKLKESMVTGTDEQIARGTQAWNDLKLQTLQSIVDNSTADSGKLSGGRFTRQLDKIGKERLETVFEPEELMQLKTIQKALEYTTIEVPESVVNYSGTGAANANNALSGILERSELGEVVQRGAENFSRIPVVGQIASPFAALIKASGGIMEDAATKASVKGVLDPQSALRRLADPKVVRKAGVAVGVAANQRNTNDKEDY